MAYGQQRLLEIAIALALQPSVLLLDEPAAGVAAGEARAIHEQLHRLPAHVAVLMVEHDMDLVFSFAQEIVVMILGSILVRGTPAQIERDPRVREAYLGGART
jgi:branched-chain amino acid transport system ATP-binding protein